MSYFKDEFGQVVVLKKSVNFVSNLDESGNRDWKGKLLLKFFIEQEDATKIKAYNLELAEKINSLFDGKLGFSEDFIAREVTISMNDVKQSTKFFFNGDLSSQKITFSCDISDVGFSCDGKNVISVINTTFNCELVKNYTDHFADKEGSATSFVIAVSEVKFHRNDEIDVCKGRDVVCDNAATKEEVRPIDVSKIDFSNDEGGFIYSIEHSDFASTNKTSRLFTDSLPSKEVVYCALDGQTLGEIAFLIYESFLTDY